MNNQAKLKKVLSAFETAILAIFEGQSEDSEASITGAKSRAEKSIPRARKVETVSDEFEFVVPVNGERARLRDEMVSEGQCKIFIGDTRKFFRVTATADGRAKLGAPHLRAIGVESGQAIGFNADEGGYRAYVTEQAERASAPKSRKAEVSDEFDADELFAEESPRKSSKGQKSKKAPSKAQLAARANFNKHRLVKCAECGERVKNMDLAAHTEGHTRKAKHVKVEVSPKQAKREEKTARAAENNRRRGKSPAAKSALRQADALRGFNVPTF